MNSQLTPSKKHLTVGPESTMAGQYLTFHLGTGIYALNLRHVKEIVGYCQPTVIPMVPAAIKGVMNLRGTVVPVMDIAIRFGQPETLVDRRTSFIIVEAGGSEKKQCFGLIVDGVNAVMEIAEDRILGPHLGINLPEELIDGLVKEENQLIIILALPRLIDL